MIYLEIAEDSSVYILEKTCDNCRFWYNDGNGNRWCEHDVLSSCGKRSHRLWELKGYTRHPVGNNIGIIHNMEHAEFICKAVKFYLENNKKENG